MVGNENERKGSESYRVLLVINLSIAPIKIGSNANAWGGDDFNIWMQLVAPPIDFSDVSQHTFLWDVHGELEIHQQFKQHLSITLYINMMDQVNMLPGGQGLNRDGT